MSRKNARIHTKSCLRRRRSVSFGTSRTMISLTSSTVHSCAVFRLTSPTKFFPAYVRSATLEQHAPRVTFRHCNAARSNCSKSKIANRGPNKTDPAQPDGSDGHQLLLMLSLAKSLKKRRNWDGEARRCIP